MRIPFYQVDAFTSAPFSGNPAAVCLLEAWLPDARLQAIAAENNLSETAFLVSEGEGWALRWFTPAVEVDLCGHATLAAAHVLYRHREVEDPAIRFRTRSGTLRVERADAGLLVMDFPARPPAPVAAPEGLAAALGTTPVEVLAARDLLVVLPDEAAVRALRPDLAALARLPHFAVAVTAAGESCDFVSRFFAPAKGVPEDPVTGSAHCTLVPYWAARLGRETLLARQVSARGGEIRCRLRGERVELAGHAVTLIEGHLLLP